MFGAICRAMLLQQRRVFLSAIYIYILEKGAFSTTTMKLKPYLILCEGFDIASADAPHVRWYYSSGAKGEKIEYGQT